MSRVVATGTPRGEPHAPERRIGLLAQCVRRGWSGPAADQDAVARRAQEWVVLAAPATCTARRVHHPDGRHVS